MPAVDCLGTVEWRLICSVVSLDLSGGDACHLGRAGRETAAELFVGMQLAVELDWPFHTWRAAQAVCCLAGQLAGHHHSL